MTIKASVLGEELILETQKGLFSPEHADRGTMAMLSTVDFQPGMRVMDLGCGCGIVGIFAAKKCGEEKLHLLMVDNHIPAGAKLY